MLFRSKRLLSRPNVPKSKLLGEGVATLVPPPPPAQVAFSATQADDTGSLNGDDDDDSKPSATVSTNLPEPEKQVIRKVVKKVVKRN